MNILFLSTTIPYPPVDGHSQRTYYLLKYLSRQHRIYLIGFIKNDADWASVEILRHLCTDIYPFVLPEDISRRALYIALIRNLFSQHPFVVQKYFHPPAQSAIETILKKGQIHLIHCDMPNLIVYAQNRPALPVITVHHDLEWLLMERRAMMELNLGKKFFFARQALRWKHFLKKIESRTKFHIVVSKLDRQRLEEISPGHKLVRVVPNGVDVEYFQPQASVFTGKSTEKAIVFLGGMHLFQNADGVEYLLQDIWPKIREMEHGVQCLIIGKNPTPYLQNLADKTQAQMLGFVADVRPYLAKAGLMVVPIRIGSGTRLKILAAMAMGKPVVSTSLGCEGIEAKDGQDILIADTAQDIAHQVVAVLRNPELQKRLGENARKLVVEKYAWAKISEVMEGIYQEATSESYQPNAGQL